MSDKLYDRFDEIRKEMHTFLEHLHKRPMGSAGFAANEWTPNANVCETETDYHVLLELPGVSADNMRLMVQGNTLIVQGERIHDSQGVDRERCLHLEIPTGYFKRELHLPGPVDREYTQARFTNGMLSVRLRKMNSGGEQREISIQSEQ